jgi:Xaa-Pro aminopeptidase
MARALVRPGAACREIDAAVRRAFAEAGYEGNPPHHTGHAMGLGGDAPRLVPGSDEAIEAGDMVTVEPGVYVPGVGGVRIEDVLLVGADGAEIISRHPRVTLIPA